MDLYNPTGNVASAATTSFLSSIGSKPWFLVLAAAVVLGGGLRGADGFALLDLAEAERVRADQVLYDVLPPMVAEQLKRDGHVPAVKYGNLGVLFADIAGFTRYASRLPPDALVMMLNQVFSRFDALARMLGIEKIKEMFDQTFQAMDAMDNFRSKAIDVMGQNNALIRDQLARADTYVDRTRQAQAREAAGQALGQISTDGPVKL
mgnify:CR=1 FL=1